VAITGVVDEVCPCRDVASHANLTNVSWRKLTNLPPLVKMHGNWGPWQTLLYWLGVGTSLSLIDYSRMCLGPQHLPEAQVSIGSSRRCRRQLSGPVPKLHGVHHVHDGGAVPNVCLGDSVSYTLPPMLCAVSTANSPASC